MSSIFGNINTDLVTVNGNQTITGKKRFLNIDSEFDGILNDPIINAESVSITPLEISFLDGLASNAQSQINGINIVLTGLTALEQALQAIEPSPNATTVQFNDSLILSDNNLSLTMTPDIITASDGMTIMATNGSIAINSPGDQVTVSAVNGFVVNSLSTISSTTLNGLNLETVDTSIPGTSQTAYFGPSTIGCDITDNITQTESYSQLQPTQLVVYSQSASGTNNSIASISSTNFNYQKSGSNPTFFPFNYASDEVFRIDSAGIKTAATKTIVLTDGSTTNTINYLGYTTRNTTANATHYLNFSVASTTGQGPIQKTAGLSCNPNTNTITASTFAGTATNATNVGITSDNTSGTYYIPFVKTSGAGNKALNIDDTTGPLSYNPSTSTVSASAYTITGTPATAGVASTFGQVGLVYLGAVQVAVTGSASAQNLSFASLFNSSYKNYRINLAPTTQVTYSAYPSYALQAFLGTGVPTTASMYGNETTSNNSGTVVSPVYTVNATISSAPLQFAVPALPNKRTVFEIRNVGFANTGSQIVELLCKSIYSNPGITGRSDRHIYSTSLNGATITGLVIQQGALSVGNDMTLEATIYGYNLI